MPERGDALTDLGSRAATRMREVRGTELDAMLDSGAWTYALDGKADARAMSVISCRFHYGDT